MSLPERANVYTCWWCVCLGVGEFQLVFEDLYRFWEPGLVKV